MSEIGEPAQQKQVTFANDAITSVDRASDTSPLLQKRRVRRTRTYFIHHKYSRLNLTVCLANDNRGITTMHRSITKRLI